MNRTSSVICRAHCKVSMWGALFKSSEFQDGSSRAWNQEAGLPSLGPVTLHCIPAKLSVQSPHCTRQQTKFTKVLRQPLTHQLSKASWSLDLVPKLPNSGKMWPREGMVAQLGPLSLGFAAQLENPLCLVHSSIHSLTRYLLISQCVPDTVLSDGTQRTETEEHRVYLQTQRKCLIIGDFGNSYRIALH